MTATIEGIAFRRDSVVIEVGKSPDDQVDVDLTHEDAVELAAGLIVHVALGAIDADEVIDPSDELNRIARAVMARSVAILCEALPRLREIREAEAAAVAGALERVLIAHEGGGEATAARAPVLQVVRDRSPGGGALPQQDHELGEHGSAGACDEPEPRHVVGVDHDDDHGATPIGSR